MAEDERAKLRALVDLLGETDRWVAAVGAEGHAEPAMGSPLAGDNKRTGMFEVSSCAWIHLTAAVDQLSTLRDATIGCEKHDEVRVNLKLFGQLTLVRGVVENAAAVIWLLTPARRERLLRRLRLASSDIKMNEAARDLMKSPGTKTKDQRLDEVRGIAKSLGLDPNAAAKSPGFEEIVHAAGQASLDDGDLAVVIWRVCSGISHGDTWAAISIPGREHLVSMTPGMANLMLSPNIDGFVLSLLVAKMLLREAFKVFEARCRSPYDSSPMLTDPAAAVGCR